MRAQEESPQDNSGQTTGSRTRPDLSQRQVESLRALAKAQSIVLAKRLPAPRRELAQLLHLGLVIGWSNGQVWKLAPKGAELLAELEAKEQEAGAEEAA